MIRPAKEVYGESNEQPTSALEVVEHEEKEAWEVPSLEKRIQKWKIEHAC